MKKLIIATVLALALSAAHAETITALYSLGISHESKRVSGETVKRDTGKFRQSIGFDYGTSTAAAEVDAIYSVSGEVSSISAVSYDLQSLTDAFGDALVFERVKFFGIRNRDATDTLLIGSGTTPWAFGMATQSTVTIPPMGCWSMSGPCNGWDASTTNRLIRIESTDGVASFDMVVGGVK